MLLGPAVELIEFSDTSADFIVCGGDSVGISGGDRGFAGSCLGERGLARGSEGLYGTGIFDAVLNNEELIFVSSSRSQGNAEFSLHVVPHVKVAFRASTVFYMFFQKIIIGVPEIAAYLAYGIPVWIVNFGREDSGCLLNLGILVVDSVIAGRCLGLCISAPGEELFFNS